VPLREIVHRALDFCYPGTCAACNSSCGGATMLCGDCRLKLTRLEMAPACDRCARPIPEFLAPCAHCTGDGISPYDKIVRLGVFDDPLKAIIHQMKYHRRWPLAEVLADRLLHHENVKGLLSETKPRETRLVPIPLYHWRQVSRGYNQSEVIARRIGKECKFKLVQPVIRLRHTETQTHLSRTKRVENLKDAFALTNARGVKGKHVIVVDDVMTTGATLQSVGRLIKQAEPATLCAIVVAVADPRHRDFQAI
jgi:ComF family protein